jgi:dipeptidyl-peptidase-4
VGIYGWSYGGYMSAMALARAPKTFKVGIAGAPVSHWDGYDTHYTERYMGLPDANAEGYANTNVMAHLDKLEGHLMLVHGLIDENVHFRHTARMINGLIAAKKRYELLLFPDERHMPRGKDDLVYMEQQIRDFIVEHL